MSYRRAPKYRAPTTARSRVASRRALRAARQRFAAPMRIPPALPTGELKGVDTALTTATVLATTNTNTSMVTLNLVSPGSGSENRIGRRIIMKSVRLRGTAVYAYAPANTTGLMNANVLRMVVVFDKQPSGAVPQFDAIFGRQLLDGTESCSYLDNLRYDNTQRFTVLRDTLITGTPLFLNGTGGTLNTNYNHFPFDEYIKLKGLTTQYSGQSVPTTISDVSSGALYVFFRATENSAGTSSWSIPSASLARLRYVDN